MLSLNEEESIVIRDGDEDPLIDFASGGIPVSMRRIPDVSMEDADEDDTDPAVKDWLGKVDQ